MVGITLHSSYSYPYKPHKMHIYSYHPESSIYQDKTSNMQACLNDNEGWVHDGPMFHLIPISYSEIFGCLMMCYSCCIYLEGLFLSLQVVCLTMCYSSCVCSEGLHIAIGGRLLVFQFYFAAYGFLLGVLCNFTRI